MKKSEEKVENYDDEEIDQKSLSNYEIMEMNITEMIA
jgi:hypothetical protein